MLKRMIGSFLQMTGKEEFTALDYLIHVAVIVNLLVALAIVWYMASA